MAGFEPTVFVVDDDESMRASLRELIASADLSVETYQDAPSFLQAYDPGWTGCLVLDVRLPEVSGLDLQAELADRGIDLPVIVISAYADIPTAVRAMKGGAIDFLEKPFPGGVLLECVERALHLEVRRHEERRLRAALTRRRDGLTAREREVMDLMVRGRSVKEVAGELGLSLKTVHIHASRVMSKMEAGSVIELAKIGATLGRP